MSKKRRYGELGQGLVEFAVIFPLFVFFLFAVLDVGIAMNRRATLQHAAREGARYAATRPQADQFVVDRTVDQSQGLVESDDVCITYADLEGDGPGPGDSVDVEIEYFYEPFILNVALGWFGSDVPDIDMTITGSSRVEGELDDASGYCP